MKICNSAVYSLQPFAAYPDMCQIISSVDRHGHNTTHDAMKMEQYRINSPLLYLASVYLFAYAKKKHCTHFLFATRDCCHWYKIFKAMFPHANAHYFHSSRNMLEVATNQQNSGYDEYVRSLVGNEAHKTIYVDIHGTGRRMYRYFEQRFNGQIPCCFLLSATYKSLDDFTARDSKKLMQMHKFKTLLFDFRGSPIEMLNYDLVGTLRNWGVDGPIRDDPEYKLKIVRRYHDVMDKIVAAIKPFDVSKVPHSSAAASRLLDLIQSVAAPISTQYPIISKKIRHVANH